MSCHCCTHSHEHAHGHHHEHTHPDAPQHAGFLHEYGRILFSALLLAGGIVMNALHVPLFQEESWWKAGWYLLAYLPVGWPVMKEAWENIRQGELFSEFTLMFIATAGAFYIGEYPEGVAVMLFYSLGELLQDKAVDKARRNIGALLDIRPESATVIRADGQSETLPPREVNVGDTIEVKTGERIPLDGTLLDEMAAFNTAALTGESVPRHLRRGEEVLAGMISTERPVRLQVTRPFEKSALARILELVRHAAERKAPAELFIRRFARIYTPVVTGLALLLVLLPWGYSWINPDFRFVFDEYLYRALVFLVLSCPCALVVSIPLGYFGGIGAASRAGILFKGGNYLDAITQVNTVVFDKTGTLTRGTFDVQECRPQPGTTEAELTELAASLECNSTHPVARALVASAEKHGIVLSPATEVEEVVGQGMKGVVKGRRILAGNIRMMEANGVDYPQELHAVADTLVACAADGRYIGCLLLSDTLKEDACEAIGTLQALGIRRIQMLSGDRQAIVTQFARKLGITEAFGDLLPDGKVAHIEELRKQPDSRIAFVGDGLNDAPVLALSHVGIAMGGLGSDAAIETADVVIQTDQPSKVATAIRAGRQTRRIVWQNVTLAFTVKLIVLLLGAGGVATLWEAVFADVGVTLIAILNAVRIHKLIK